MLDDMFIDLPEEETAGPCPKGKTWDPITKQCIDLLPEVKIYSPEVLIQYGSTSEGANMVAKDKGLKLYDANTQWISERQKEMDELDIKYAKNIFTQLNRVPTVDNKQISLAELSTAMSDVKKRKAIMDQALKLNEDPTLDADTRWSLIENHIKSTFLAGEILEGTKRMNEDMAKAASAVDAINGGSDTWISTLGGRNHAALLFRSNGTLKTKAEYERDLKAAHAAFVGKGIEQWEKEHPMPENAPMYIQRSDMPNPMATYGRQFVKDKNGKIIELDSRPKAINSMEGWWQARGLQGSILGNTFNNFTYKNVKETKNVKAYPSYETVYNAVIAQYNSGYNPVNLGPNSPRKLSADIEGKFKGNKGGMFHSAKMSVDFDFSNSSVKADEITTNNQTGEVTTQRKTILRTGPQSLIELLKVAGSDADKVIVVTGGVSTSIPRSSDSNGNAIVKALIDEVISKHDKDSKLIPRGSITFQGIVGADDKYHAYHVKMDRRFWSHRQFTGKGKVAYDDNKDKPDSELIDEGFTIYVPAELSSKKIKSLGGMYKKASEISAVEGLFTWKNEIPIDIPEAGKIHLIKDEKTGDIIMNSYHLHLNRQGKYDTVPIPAQTKTFKADAATDLDRIIKDNMEIFKQIFMFNQQAKQSLATPGKVGNE